MEKLLERQAKKNYENFSKELKELYTLDDFIKQVKKEWGKQNGTIKC